MTIFLIDLTHSAAEVEGRTQMWENNELNYEGETVGMTKHVILHHVLTKVHFLVNKTFIFIITYLHINIIHFVVWLYVDLQEEHGLTSFFNSHSLISNKQIVAEIVVLVTVVISRALVGNIKTCFIYYYYFYDCNYNYIYYNCNY